MWPPLLEAVAALREENALLVRGHPEEIEALRDFLELVDVPRRQVRIRVSTGGRTAEGLVSENAALRLSGGPGGEGFQLTALPRIEGDGSVSVALDGEFGRGRPVQTEVRVRLGERTVVFSRGAGERRVELQVQVAVVPQG